MHSIPINQFKMALHQDKTLIGLWLGLANSYSSELLATIGYDWLLIDGEHAPNSISTILQQLQSIAPYQHKGYSFPVVRPPLGDSALIKQYLDIGVQSLLVPMVETAEQAKLLVSSMHYPPDGIRGVGSALARASLWSQIDEYLNLANEQMCLLAQVENVEGLNNIDEIASVAGVDGIFIGPADLSAALGHRGNPQHPEVQEAILHIARVTKSKGKALGILYADPKMAKTYIDAGFNFVAVGVDTSLLVKSAKSLLGQFKSDIKPSTIQTSIY
ncbi:4-hydroxy-2-oxoheptanedioate aldolase [Thorsellia kenyensis]|uniref:4-hydroxy-2-oxoheptanedioate aldolase n=1 Tax=Thorsellia kenyensis TaxID=1549888 RepID=A0ABV6CAN9_9GAMM